VGRSKLDRDAEMIRVYGDNYWSMQIIKDPAMAAALKFLRNLIGEVSQVASVDSREFSTLVSDAGVLRPANS
jgi:hypothetical protein